MKSIVSIVVAFAAGILACATAGAGPSDPITVQSVTSNAFNNGSSAANLIDGHLYTSMTGYYGVDIPYPYVTFNFGASYNLGVMKVANYIRAENYYNNRGWKDVAISVSPDATSPFTSIGTYTFVRGYDGINCYDINHQDPSADFQTSIDLTGVSAWRMRWDVVTTYAPASVPIPLNTEWAVSEVQFHEAAAPAVPEPASLALVALGALGLILHKK